MMRARLDGMSYFTNDPIDREADRGAADLRALGGPPVHRPSLPRRLWAGIVATWREHDEVQQRLAILRRPWTFDQAHWVPGPHGPVLHGSTPPPRGGRGPVTSGGWCACHRKSNEQLDELIAHRDTPAPAERAIRPVRSTC